MEPNKILDADILDILFEGRNKEYGAYELRKFYNRRMTRSIIIMLAICLLIFIGSVIAKKISDLAPKQMVVQDVQLEDVKTPEKKDEPPPPPPPPKEPPKVEVTKFTPPKIVKDEEVKPEEKPPEQEKLEDTKIGAFNQEGAKDETVAPPTNESTGGTVAPKSDNEDYDKVFTSVEIPAKFKGQDFAKFEQTHINAEAPTESGAPAGNYVVQVTFTIDKSGNISDIVFLKDPGYGCKDEVTRVLKNTSGQWTPAQQNGKSVIFRQTQNVVFQVQDQ